MMITNRIKGSMMMAAFTAVMTFAAMGCTDEEPKTPAEQLLQAAQDGNKRIDAVLAHHEVLTTQIVSETLAPIDHATEGFNAELISWQDVQVDPKFQSHELEIYAKAGVEIANLTAKLDAQGFALGSAVPPDGSDSCTSGSDCECSEVAPAPTDITREGVDSDPAGMGDLTEKVYWKRLLCRGACGTAQALCTAACGPVFVTGVLVPAALACVVACSAVGALCQDACATSYPNCR